MITLREREREQNQFGKCSECLNPDTNHKSNCSLKCNKCNDNQIARKFLIKIMEKIDEAIKILA